jgi:hypothetical protein
LAQRGRARAEKLRGGEFEARGSPSTQYSLGFQVPSDSRRIAEYRLP